MIIIVPGSYQILLHSSCERFLPGSEVPLGPTLEVTHVSFSGRPHLECIGTRTLPGGCIVLNSLIPTGTDWRD